MKLSAIISMVTGSVLFFSGALYLIIQEINNQPQLDFSNYIKISFLTAICIFSIVVLIGIQSNKTWGVMAFLSKITFLVGSLIIFRFNINGYLFLFDYFVFTVLVMVQIFIGYFVFNLKEKNLWKEGEFGE